MRLISRCLGLTLQLGVVVAWLKFASEIGDQLVAMASVVVLISIALSLSIPTLVAVLDVLAPLIVITARQLDLIAPGLGSVWAGVVITMSMNQACVCAI